MGGDPSRDIQDQWFDGCRNGDAEKIGLLLQHYPNLITMKRGDLQETGLHLACRQGRLDVVTKMIEKNRENSAFLKQKNAHEATGFHLACRYGFYQLVKTMLIAHAQLVFEIDDFEETGLYHVFGTSLYEDEDCIFQKEKIINALLEITSEDAALHVNFEENTPAHCACREGYLWGVEILFKRQPIAFTLVNKAGKIPLELAKEEKREDVVSFLEKKRNDQSSVFYSFMEESNINNNNNNNNNNENKGKENEEEKGGNIIEGIEYPPEWTEKEEEKVEEGTEEWKQVLKAIHDNRSGIPFVHKITKITRIQNRKIYKGFYNKKKEMVEQGKVLNEKWAKHSASNGFEDSYRPGKLWGFTYDSHQVAKTKNYIILARILAGENKRDSNEKKNGDYWLVTITHQGAYPGYRVDFDRNDL